jgi:hypothetical protein
MTRGFSATNLSDLTYSGPDISDPEIISRLPKAYSRLLKQVNGFIAFEGGLHIRGAVKLPRWHSLREAWTGDLALYRLFPELSESDIPFGQDYVGDQFILRDDVVFRMSGETGQLESLETDFDGFLKRAQKDPENYLFLNPLSEFQEEGGKLTPGQLLNVIPPFILKESEKGVLMRAIPVSDQIKFLADFASQIAGAGDGTEVTLKVVVKPPGH